MADAHCGLAVAAFMLDQEALARDGAGATVASSHRVPLASVETQTGLDFGDALRTAAALP